MANVNTVKKIGKISFYAFWLEVIIILFGFYLLKDEEIEGAIYMVILLLGFLIYSLIYVFYTLYLLRNNKNSLMVNTKFASWALRLHSLYVVIFTIMMIIAFS